jgi:hypothetical protein
MVTKVSQLEDEQTKLGIKLKETESEKRRAEHDLENQTKKQKTYVSDFQFLVGFFDIHREVATVVTPNQYVHQDPTVFDYGYEPTPFVVPTPQFFGQPSSFRGGRNWQRAQNWRDRNFQIQQRPPQPNFSQQDFQ